jgi:hypothetical protein
MKQTTTIKNAAQCLLKNNLLRLAFVLISITFSFNHVFAQNVSIPDVNFRTMLLADLTINTNADGNISYAEAYAYSGMIDASGLSISDLTGIEAFTALTILDVGNNNLTTLDLTTCTSLVTIDCSNNNLTYLNLFNLVNVTTLYANNNSLTCLDLHSNTGLVTLFCGTNSLTSLNLQSGNNVILTTMNAMGAGGMLYCIQVDNVAASMAAPGWQEDTWSTYSTNCVPGVITASFNDDAPVCIGTPVTFTDATAGFVNWWHWAFGDGTTSNVQNPTHTYGGGAYFWVTLIAGNCNHSDTVGMNVQQGNDITGHVTYTGGDVTSGTAVLMPHVATFGTFDTMYTSPLDPFGYYSFPHVIDGNYIIKVFPDTVSYPTLENTYYYSEWAWDSAAVFSHGCYVANYGDITMVEDTANGSGPGAAAGMVLEGPGFGRAQGDPIHGVDVKLGVTGSSAIVASTETDINGVYTFGNINYGSYTVYVDIPGLYRSPLLSFTIDSANTTFSNLIYLVDSVHVYPAPSIGIETQDDLNLNSLWIYPNPTKENSNIQFTLVNDANVKLEVYNVYGVKVQNMVNAAMNAGEYSFNFKPKENNLKSGMYFITLTVNGKSRSLRTIVME